MSDAEYMYLILCFMQGERFKNGESTRVYISCQAKINVT